MRTRQTLAALSVVALVLVAVGCSSGAKKSAEKAASTTTTSGSEKSGDKSGDGGGSVRLPAGWPPELALPSDTTLISAVDLGSGSLMVVATNDGDSAQPTYDALKGQLTSAGYEIVGSTFTPSDKGGFGSISAKGPAYTVAIAFGPNDNATTNQVTINVAKVEANP